MGAARIEFFWDPVSPYTYLASTQIEALAERVGAELVWRPFFLGGVMQATGNRPPAEVPNKARYMLEDLRLWARWYGVPFRFPPSFPALTLKPLRIAIHAQHRGGVGPTFAKLVMARHWGQGEDVADEGVLRELAAEVGLDPGEALAAVDDSEVKAELRANTDEAVARGAFGAPSLFVGERLFWGNDRLPLLEALLRGELA